jgi:hypothetical protein
VRITLTLPTETLVELLGADTALEELISLAMKYLDKSGKGSSEVTYLLLQHLCSDLLNADTALAETRILLTLLPFLMPIKENEMDVMIHLIKQHSFINKCKFLAALIKGKFLLSVTIKVKTFSGSWWSMPTIVDSMLC